MHAWQQRARVFATRTGCPLTTSVNRRANRMKVLVHDGIGVWLAARRLNRGKFVWPNETQERSAWRRAFGQLDQRGRPFGQSDLSL